MSSLFFKVLPIDIIRIILKYLNLNELSNFDLSLLNYKERYIYLLSLNHLELNNINNIPCNKLFIDWLIKRKVLIKEIWLRPVDKNAIELFQLNKNYLEKVILTCQGATDEMLLYLNKCINLSSITAERCVGISDEGMIKLFEGNKQLQYISLIGCIKLTNISMQLISQSSKLEYLNLVGLECVTDTEIFQIIKGCPKLKIIQIRLANITDRSIEALLESYPNIECLLIDDCRFTSLNGLFSILRSVALKMLYNEENLEIQKLNLSFFRIIISHPNHNRHSANEIVNMNILPQLIYFITCKHSEELQLDSLHILSSLTCLASYCIPNLVESNIISLLVNLTKHENEEISEISAHILGFIASYSIVFRDLIISSNALSCLSSNYRSSISSMEYAIFAISCLCNSDPCPPFHELHVVVPFLLKVIFKQKKSSCITEHHGCLSHLDLTVRTVYREDAEDSNRDTESEMNSYDFDDEDEEDEEFRVKTFHILNRIIFSVSNSLEVKCLLDYDILNYFEWIIQKFRYIALVHDMIQCFLHLYPPISSIIDERFGNYMVDYSQK